MISVWLARCENKCRTHGKGMNRVHCDVVDWNTHEGYGTVLRQEVLK